MNMNKLFNSELKQPYKYTTCSLRLNDVEITKYKYTRHVYREAGLH